MLQHPSKKFSLITIPVIAYILTILVSIFLSYMLRKKEEEHIKKLLTVRADSLKMNVEKLLESRILALDRMAKRWVKRVEHRRKSG